MIYEYVFLLYDSISDHTFFFCRPIEYNCGESVSPSAAAWCPVQTNRHCAGSAAEGGGDCLPPLDVVGSIMPYPLQLRRVVFSYRSRSKSVQLSASGCCCSMWRVWRGRVVRPTLRQESGTSPHLSIYILDSKELESSFKQLNFFFETGLQLSVFSDLNSGG